MQRSQAGDTPSVFEHSNGGYPRFRDVGGNERPVLSDREVTTYRGTP
jgi:hypothetical protein